MPKVLLSLGSNIAPQTNLRAALDALKQLPGLRGLRTSRWYQAPAVGFDGPDFVNGASVGEWLGDLSELQLVIRELEDRAARDRNAPKFSSRTLDIDVVLYGDAIIEEGSGIPRDELLEHAFVLRPCAELEPDWVHPQTGRRLGAHWLEWRVLREDPLTPLVIKT